ncbi:GGDEF domain-containing protein [Amorphus orientalis]|uniref:diguanylate cyclase n=1 Tax=Amorphus orientalis TaxID=649198 RepID=A0AAE3VRY0_9HYPH|nr:GGDEF domain-containing protein [Amorphus orientalis]MDQ0316551.1 diguanylate cyclase (GGDEF)-like protein [Amorphus orientalis]
MTGVCCGALFIVTLVAWLTERKQPFLLTWSLSVSVLLASSVAFSLFATQPTVFIGWLASWTSAAGAVGLWLAAVQFAQGSTPLFGAGLRFLAAILGLSLFAAIGMPGSMLVVMNATMAIVLFQTAAVYFQVRRSSIYYLVALSGLYAATAATFLVCGLSLLFQFPADFLGIPRTIYETINGLVAIVTLTGSGALSVALVHERTAKRHQADAMTDPLTGLLNRRALLNIGQAAGLSDGAAAIVFDLDNFKSVNDAYGHDVGDLVIRRFTVLCRQSLRATDLAARTGGEEFVVILQGADAETAMAVAERIRARFEAAEIRSPKGLITGCTVSAGVLAAPPGSGLEIQDLIARADEALYDAKRAGRNRVRLIESETPAQDLRL